MLDAALLVDYFKRNGWEITTKFHEADMIMLGACGFDTESERVSKKFLSTAKKRKGVDARLIVFGCLPGINEPLIREFGLMGMTRSSLEKLDSITNATVGIRELDNPTDFDSYLKHIKKSFSFLDEFRAYFKLPAADFIIKTLLPILRVKRTGAFSARYPQLFNIRIAGGCNGLCSYCAIKNAVGPLTSKPLNAIMKQFSFGLQNGYKAFRLIAEDVGSYGQDISSNIVELLGEICNQDKDFKLIIDDFSPKWFVKYFQELLEIFAKNASRIGYLGLPVQSGSEKILRLMKREYSAENVRKCILVLRQACAELEITTHIMIGFPGETDRDFVDTLNFIRSVQFDQVAIYKYSDRPNTCALELCDKISEWEKLKRIWKIAFMIGPHRLVY